MFGNSSGTEMDVDIDTTMRTKPPIEREEKLRRQWSIFLRKLYKLALDSNQIIHCTVPLSYVCFNFKIIKEICECDKERWK